MNLDDIQKLLHFDSKLLYIVPYICPQTETSLLCDILPIEIAIVWLIKTLEYNRFSLSSISDFMVN